MKKVLLIFTILFSLLSGNCLGQQPKTDKYVIITFEHRYKITMHGTRSYYWILPQDSIKLGDLHLSKLFLLYEYSVNNFNDCYMGKPIDPTDVLSYPSYDFAEGYISSADSLKKMIKPHRELIQTIIKNWKGGQKETLKIYATPVSGKFCRSSFIDKGKYPRGYKGDLYIPYSSYAYDPGFWKTEQAQVLSNKELSSTNFSVFQN